MLTSERLKVQPSIQGMKLAGERFGVFLLKADVSAGDSIFQRFEITEPPQGLSYARFLGRSECAGLPIFPLKISPPRDTHLSRAKKMTFKTTKKGKTGTHGMRIMFVDWLQLSLRVSEFCRPPSFHSLSCATACPSLKTSVFGSCGVSRRKQAKQNKKT